MHGSCRKIIFSIKNQNNLRRRCRRRSHKKIAPAESHFSSETPWILPHPIQQTQLGSANAVINAFKIPQLTRWDQFIMFLSHNLCNHLNFKWNEISKKHALCLRKMNTWNYNFEFRKFEIWKLPRMVRSAANMQCLFRAWIYPERTPTLVIMFVSHA